MAITKIWKISGSIDSSISYIEDEKKTREKDHRCYRDCEKRKRANSKEASIIVSK